MTSKVNRIFVGNLPTNITEKDVETEFSAYGTVSKVEVKNKTDPLTNDVLSTFAFVTISVTDSDLNQCLTEFKNEPYRGRYLLVSVARENFMEKLKREREESSSQGSNWKSTAETSKSEQQPKIRKNVRVIQTDSSDSDSSDSSNTTTETSNNQSKQPKIPKKINKADSSESESSDGTSTSSKSSLNEPAIVVKKKSKAVLENGKIKIPSINGTNNLTSSTTRVERKNLDEKSLKADKKRLDSLIKMKNTYDQQKKAVQQSLSSIDTKPQNKKIIFDMPTPTPNEMGNVKNKSKPLFADDDEDDQCDYEKNFEIKRQYEGESGARLQKLQSKFQNDQRFNMNEKFLDEDNEDEVEQVADDDGESKSDERKWQYDMLESVIGKKLQSEDRKKSDNPMLRYDPTRNDHVKYEKVLKRKANNKDTDLASSKHTKLNDETDFEVSKEQFYNVTNQLTSALAPSSEGFSLLSMFGRGTDFVEKNPKDAYKEILLTKGHQKSLTTTFNDESSDEEIIQERLTKAKDVAVNNSKQSNSKKSVKPEIVQEPFFIFGDDQRLLDGLSLFLSNASQNGVTDEFESKQKEMRNIIKKKIKKSIRNVIPRHGKLNKRFGRLVKNS